MRNQLSPSANEWIQVQLEIGGSQKPAQLPRSNYTCLRLHVLLWEWGHITRQLHNRNPSRVKNQTRTMYNVQCTYYNFPPVQCCYLPQVFAKTIIHLNGVLKRINREAGSEIVTFIAQLYDNMNSEPQIICPQSWQITFQSQETFCLCQLR